jgi:hypothetical protein
VAKEKPPKVSHKFHELLAAYAFSFWDEKEKGGGDPEDWPEIEERLRRAEVNLLRYVESLESKAK